MESIDPDDLIDRIVLKLSKPDHLAPWPTDSPRGSLCIIRDDEIERLQAEVQRFGVTSSSFSRRQICTILIFAISNIFSGNIISIQAPFYPKEAEEKGATPSEYGFVFGVFHLTMMIFSPIHGTLLGKISPKLIFSLGIFTSGTFTILFGLLDYVNDRVTFIVLSFIIRIIQATGHSANIAASFTIIAVEFPDSVATTFAALETCFGIGLIMGPSAGGALYEVGGFILPFLLMGSLVVVTAMAACFFLANVPPGAVDCGESTESDGRAAGGGQLGFFSLIKIPAVALAGCSIAVSASSIGFLNATLEPHLREKFNLTPIYTGLMFIIDGSMYALSAPLWGRLCGKFSQPKFVTLLGCCLTFTGFIFIGPAPFMPFDSILWITIIGLATHGLGMGASFVAAFLIGLQDAIANGFPDNVATYGLVSGMWVTFLALGSFIGPSVGGILLDNFGFNLGSLFVLVTQVIMGTITILFICGASSKRNGLFGNGRRRDENDPLLASKNGLIYEEPQADPSSSSLKSKNYGST